MSVLALHQVAGLYAGGSLPLAPGQWDVGPAAAAAGSLMGGEPDRVGFTLSVNESMRAWVVPGTGRVRLDDEPVVDPLPVDDRVINAGTGRFVVSHTVGDVAEAPLPAAADALHPWLIDPIPGPIARGAGIAGGPDVLDIDDLVRRRLSVHPGPVGLQQAVTAGQVWSRSSDHFLYGLAAVGMADLEVESARYEPEHGRPSRHVVPTTVALDVLRDPTVLVGRREHQLAVAAQLLVNLATTTHPDSLHLDLQTDLPDLDFIRRVPHAKPGATSQRRRLMVVDRDTALPSNEGRRPIRRWPVPADGASLLVLARRNDPIPPTATVVTIADESALTIHTAPGARGGPRVLGGVTPIGVSHALALELADGIAKVGG